MRVVSLLLVLLVLLSGVTSGCGASVPLSASNATTSPDPGPTREHPIVLVAAAWMPETEPPPINREPFYFTFEKWMDTIEEETGGRVVFKRYPSGSLVDEADGWEAVKNGICDIFIVLAASYEDQFPRTDLMALPNLFPNATVASMVLQQLQDEGWLDPEWADVKVLWHATNSPADVGCRLKQIKTLEDWKDIKVAVVGEPETSAIEALGAIPVNIPKTEQYKALEKGMVDAAWLELNGQVAFQFYEVAPYHTICHGGVRSLDYVMNWDAYRELPDDIRAVFDKNSGMLWSIITGEIFDSCLKLSADFLNEQEPSTYVPPADEFARWQQAWAPVYEKAVAKLKARGIDGEALLARMRELSAKYSEYLMDN